MENTLREEVSLLHAELCQALADPTRILILYSLADGKRRVNEIAELLDVRQPTVSRHLKLLRDRGLVNAERDGTAVWYELRDRRVIEALDLLRAVMGSVLADQAKLASAVRG